MQCIKLAQHRIVALPQQTPSERSCDEGECLLRSCGFMLQSMLRSIMLIRVGGRSPAAIIRAFPKFPTQAGAICAGSNYAKREDAS
jgi:hypothetical protein